LERQIVIALPDVPIAHQYAAWLSSQTRRKYVDVSIQPLCAYVSAYGEENAKATVCGLLTRGHPAPVWCSTWSVLPEFAVVTVTTLGGREIHVGRCPLTETVRDVKRKVEGLIRLPRWQQSLVYQENVLPEHSTLRTAGLRGEVCLQLIKEEAEEDEPPPLVDSSSDSEH